MSSYNVKFGPAVCALQDFLPSYLWNTWHWKLDSYCIPLDTVSPALTITSFDITLDDSSMLELLQSEPSGFYEKQVFTLKNRDSVDTVYRLVEQNTQAIMLEYLIDQHWSRIHLLQDRTNSAGHAAFEYMGNMISHCLIEQQVLTFHGVLLEYKGNGIILSAASGTGKTTHARLWRDHKAAFIINGDRTSCYKDQNHWCGFGMPWCGTSGEHMNRQVPITALVVLEQSEENEAELLTVLDAFGAVLPHIQIPTWNPELVDAALGLMDDFLSQVPVIRLRCRPDIAAVDVLAHALEELNHD